MSKAMQPKQVSEQYSGTFISDLIEQTEAARLRAELLAICDIILAEGLVVDRCEYVCGQTQSDPGGGEPCGQPGIYREAFAIPLCDRHAKVAQ